MAFNAYTEDIYVGYRYFETFAPDRVLYPFGFGLSYTRFRLSSQAAVSGNQVTVNTTVENVGDEAGREVVQVYVDLPCGTLGNPKRVLAGFKKTGLLQPGQQQVQRLRQRAGRSQQPGWARPRQACFQSR